MRLNRCFGVIEAKRNLGLDPEKEFYVEKEAYDFFAKRPTAYTKHDKSISENDLF